MKRQTGYSFLDEIGLIPFEVQEKILRVVEYGTFERVGSSETKEINVRILGAANQDLPALCREGKFKQDLLDRLSFEVLFVPPLRARGEDLFILADYFAQKMGRELGKKGRISFTDEVVMQLKTYSWPGNIRELKNTVERAVYRTEGNYISEIVLNPFVNPYADAGAETGAEFGKSVIPAAAGIEDEGADMRTDKREAFNDAEGSSRGKNQPYPHPESFNDFLLCHRCFKRQSFNEQRNSIQHKAVKQFN